MLAVRARANIFGTGRTLGGKININYWNKTRFSLALNGEYNDAVEMALVYSKRPDAPNSFALGMAYTNNVGIGEALGVVTGSNDTRVDGSPVKLRAQR